ncbi:MAG: ATP-binding protein [Dehalococcoidia bacterium]|nr:ATP-binding protein [Dehalococcoidia bacterium]
MSNYIKKLEVIGLYGRFNLVQEFTPGVNVLYGHNGSCKTTLLHILSNLANGQFERFAFLSFRSISVVFDDDHLIKLTRKKDRDDVTGVSDELITVEENNEFVAILSVTEIESREPSLYGFDLLKPSSTSLPLHITEKATIHALYFPAFRNVVDAFKATFDHGSVSMETRSTEFIRHWLLPFVPEIVYPSLVEIEQELIRSCVSQISDNKIEHYLKCVNGLLEGKNIIVTFREQGDPVLELRFDDGSRSRLSALSSGERQIVILIYAAMKCDGYKLLLIDEPEISLHVGWQRVLLKKLSKKSSHQQIIVCTHSPVIGADYPASHTNLSIFSFSEDSEDIPL